MHGLFGELNVILILLAAFLVVVFHDLMKQKWGKWWLSSKPRRFKETFIQPGSKGFLVKAEGDLTKSTQTTYRALHNRSTDLINRLRKLSRQKHHSNTETPHQN